MKVKIEMTVDIDPEAWRMNYGTEDGAAALREDVKRYCEGTVREQLAIVGVLSDA